MKKLRALFQATLLSAIVLLSNTCAHVAEDVIDPPRPENYLSKYSMSKTHTKGSTGCPQFLDLIEVYCSPSPSSQCTADSVSISNPHPGLITEFSGGNATNSTLTTNPFDAINFTVQFSCSVPQTINHIYVLIFYNKGVEVSRENVEVTVTVK